MMQNAFGALALDATVENLSEAVAKDTTLAQVRDTLLSGHVVIPKNVSTQLREAFNTFVDGDKWDVVKAAGDLVILDGNTVANSYLVISKDPFGAGTETSVTSKTLLKAPLEAIVGLSMSQRIYGQEFAVEFIATETQSVPQPANLISEIFQGGSVLWVTTQEKHGLSAGSRIAVSGVPDSRLNYGALVVSAVVDEYQFKCTAGPGVTVSSTTTSTFNSGFVHYRHALGYAEEGFSQVFEGTSVSGSSYYIDSGSKEPRPSGTLNGNHIVTCSTTNSKVDITAPFAYAFSPTSEYRYMFLPDRLQMYDGVVDPIVPTTHRISSTQTIPDADRDYKLRFRFKSSESFSTPTGNIVSSTKAGSTTATVVLDRPHNLTTTDYVVVYGNANQTLFGNFTTPTQVLSVVDEYTITLAYGTSTTANTYGGIVIKVNGPTAPTAPTGAINTVTAVNGYVTTVSSSTATYAIGDYVNLCGVVTMLGEPLGLDGVYKIVDQTGTTTRLSPVGFTAADVPNTSCGGALMRRADARISYARVFDYHRQRVELAAKPYNDQNGAVSMYLTGGTLPTVSSASLAAALKVVDISSASLTSTATSTASTPAAGALAYTTSVLVSAASGTNRTLDVVVQESDDDGTNWFDVYHFPRITATGMYRSPLLPVCGNRIRYVQTVSGTTPSFTRAIQRLNTHLTAPTRRQFFNRTVAPNTLNSTTPVFFVDGCTNLNVVVSMAAATTAPVFVLEGSADGSTAWYPIGADITGTVSMLQYSNVQAVYVRLRVKTAGTGSTLDFVMLKGSE